MPDETSGVGGQAPASDAATGQAPQANNGGSPSTAPQGQAPEGHTATLTQADYERMLAEVRKEAASQRVKLKAFEDAQAAAELAKLSDADKAAKRAEAAEAALSAARTRIGASELKLASQGAGIIDPDVAVALLAGKVEYDAGGEPTNVAEIVAQLKKDKPHLFGGAGNGASGQPAARQAATAGGATNPGRQAGNAGLTQEMIQAMPMRERVARIDEIRAWEKANRQP